MRVTSSSVARELRQTLDAFRDFGIASTTNSVFESNRRVTWNAADSTSSFLLSRDNLTVEGYLHWLEHGHYSAVLDDGAILQLTYDFDSSGIVGHRLAYVPCPVDVSDKDSRVLLAAGFAWGDVVRAALTSAESVLMKTAVRFDFDPSSATLHHPASHFTMNTVDCRIACTMPLRTGRFLDFVFKTFYPDLYQKNDYLQSFPKGGWFESTLSEEHRQGLHLAWTP